VPIGDMMTTKKTPAVEQDDTNLVAESLQGNRDAFCQIVERYQTLITSLAYCATGNVGLSEDLAQETFVRAWRQLADLREPPKLRSWLCSIARFLIGKEFRRLGHEPVHGAQTLEAAGDLASTEPSAPDRVISEEEKALLWRSLERIPEVYRAALILFYREDQSVKAVARDLELSEEAVRQRLSRGRKLLEQQLIDFVGGALRQTKPDRSFTLNVMSVLPVLATSAKTATAVGTASKGGSVVKGTWFGMLAGPVMALFSMFSAFGVAGRWVGRRMGLASLHSVKGLRRTVQFWRTLAIGFIALILPSVLVHPKGDSYPWLQRAETVSIATFYWLVAIALMVWILGQRKDARRNTPIEGTDPVTMKSFNLWVSLGTAGPALILILCLCELLSPSHRILTRSVSRMEALSIIQTGRTDVRYSILQFRNGSRYLHITVPENRLIDLSTPLDDSLQVAMKDRGITCRTLVEDQDFHNGGVRGWFMLLSTFITVAGCVLLLRRPGSRMFHEQEVATPRAEMKEKKILALCGALSLTAMSVLLVAYMVAHSPRTISSGEAASIVSGHSNCLFEVFQYDDGSRELWITLPRSRHHPDFVTPADETTLALLASKDIPSRTFVQGKDFGYRWPSRWFTLSCVLLMAGGATCLLWWLIKVRPAHQVPAGVRV
jgi:RNA polymerase sigma factor (sigma-70 family)